jgi:hypothetical protein
MSALAVVAAVLLVYALVAIFIYGRGLLYGDADAAAVPSPVRRWPPSGAPPLN